MIAISQPASVRQTQPSAHTPHGDPDSRSEREGDAAEPRKPPEESNVGFLGEVPATPFAPDGYRPPVPIATGSAALRIRRCRKAVNQNILRTGARELRSLESRGDRGARG